MKTYAQRLEEPLGLPAGVALLEVLLNLLLRVFPLRRLLERLGRDGALEALELERVTGGEKVRVVDDLHTISIPPSSS